MVEEHVELLNVFPYQIYKSMTTTIHNIYYVAISTDIAT